MSNHDHDHHDHAGHASPAGEAMEGWEVLTRAQALAAQGEEFALATVVWRQGPSSGKPGARAIVTADGGLIGWIGGACTEPIVIREAAAVIASREPRLLLLGQPGQFGEDLPEGMVFTPMTCQSEGSLEVYLEPVIPAPHLMVVGRSPMAQTLVDLARVLGWDAELRDGSQFSASDPRPRTVVVIATQGHGDEEAVQAAVESRPSYVGLVASRKRGAAVVDFLRDQGVEPGLLDSLHVPVGLDLGHTTHREIAVAVLAELVQRRAAGEFTPGIGRAHHAGHVRDRKTLPLLEAPEAIDPVCGMTVAATESSYPFELDGTTYYFCCAPCRVRFSGNPAAYLQDA